MTCVFSFCGTDFNMAYHLAMHIEVMGGVSKHQCLMLHPEDVDGWEVESCLKRAFGHFRAITYKETYKGWPDGPNQCFAVAARGVLRMEASPWLWCEADCVLTRPEWLDDIETEYRFCGQPILGVLENTYGVEGEIVGKHVNGVAVYPHDWWKICPLMASLETATEGYRQTGNLPPAFDCYQAGYSTPRCAESKMIQNLWKSYGFTEENGVVRCQFKQEYGAPSVVDMGAALIHGSKDFSLLTLAQSRLLV